ncbi:MAG TPA: TonB family protein, partial [Saprospiraceae bacterium]|nr:TonB family protein [Saprospiraceae bacterium]
PSPAAGQADMAASEQADMPPGPAAAQPARAADGRLEKPATTAPTYAQSDESASRSVSTGAAAGQAAPASAAADDLAMAAQKDKAEEEKPAERRAEAVADREVESKKEAVAKPLPAAPLTKADTLWSPTGTPPDMAKRRKAARDAILPAQSGPADSWEAFQDYLRQTARLTPLAKEKGVSGTVRLQFSVNANGEPQGFITLRSVGYGCDQEAIRLVKDWVWVRGQNPVVTVEIPFVR